MITDAAFVELIRASPAGEAGALVFAQENFGRQCQKLTDVPQEHRVAFIAALNKAKPAKVVNRRRIDSGKIADAEKAHGIGDDDHDPWLNNL